ncbi:uncharacterized protein Bfra_010824 [Botrytis fragariae]|uniref:Uncharacterized protein n=1 Tax=Botrytis fragariae TaxID=1964551 RepID=A0A8H6EET1_9HELO|nr:uncharacterized protein Bfra_010824 [Botrytis fragariae]KAF5869627.1 hypothetical protein Bfra_010824 [Botrytis fragariae]
MSGRASLSPSAADNEPASRPLDGHANIDEIAEAEPPPESPQSPAPAPVLTKKKRKQRQSQRKKGQQPTRRSARVKQQQVQARIQSTRQALASGDRR